MARGTETPEQRKRRLRSEELAAARTIVERQADYEREQAKHQQTKSYVVSWAKRELDYANKLATDVGHSAPVALSMPVGNTPAQVA